MIAGPPPVLKEHKLPGGRVGTEVLAEDPETGQPALHMVVADRELDRLKDGRWISHFQYDAGVRLRGLWEEADVRLGVRAADFEARAGRGPVVAIGNAEGWAEYVRCLRLVHVGGRGIVIAVCIDDVSVQEYARRHCAGAGAMMARLKNGLVRLAAEFSR